MISMLGWLGSGLVVVSLLQHDIRRLRQVNLVAAATLGIFNVALGITSMIVLNLVLAAVNGIHLIRGRKAAETSAPPTYERRSISAPCAADAIRSCHPAAAARGHRAAIS